MTDHPATPDPADAEQKRKTKLVVKLMGELLIARKDVKAIESKNGWMPDRGRIPRGTPASEVPCLPITMEDFRQHLYEKRCMGTYLLNPDNKVKFFAIDLDLRTEDAIMFPVPDMTDWEAKFSQRQLPDDTIVGTLDINKTYVGNVEEALHNPDHVGYRWARMGLRSACMIIAQEVRNQLGLYPLCVITGGGAHILVPLGGLLPAVEARAMANVVMEASGYELFKGDCFWQQKGTAGNRLLDVEVFPKQNELSATAGFGNLIRLPLGWHMGAKKRSFFMDTVDTLPPWTFPKVNAIEELERAAKAVGIGM